MRNPRRATLVLAFLALGACRREPPKAAPPPPPPPLSVPAATARFGVHVASALDSTARARFTVTVAGSLELGIRAPFFAMRRDKSLILSTPADLLVNKGAGSAVIAAADSDALLVVTPLDSTDAAATARGHAVRLERVGDSHHLTATALASAPEVKR